MDLSLTAQSPSYEMYTSTDEQNDHSLLKRFGRDVFTYLDVIRLIAANKIDIYRPGVHKSIFLKCLYAQMFESLCRHVSLEENEDDYSFDKKSTLEVLHSALETDNRYADFRLGLGYDKEIVRLPKTIYRSINDDKSNNKENEDADKTLTSNINNFDKNNNSKNEDSQDDQYQSCNEDIDFTKEENTVIAANNITSAQCSSRKRDSTISQSDNENIDDDSFSTSLLDMANTTFATPKNHKLRRECKIIDPIELTSMSFNVANSMQTRSTESSFAVTVSFSILFLLICIFNLIIF